MPSLTHLLSLYLFLSLPLPLSLSPSPALSLVVPGQSVTSPSSSPLLSSPLLFSRTHDQPTTYIFLNSAGWLAGWLNMTPRRHSPSPDSTQLGSAAPAPASSSLHNYNYNYTDCFIIPLDQLARRRNSQ
ncbi:hypothetical protein HDK90DRAFT_469953 [Phyllosticta capitalensis]|uniref:Uncharacterized protein n=1 Tax=Phyllosticta capitalensis TaxID=121624 RepID=A0ABR1YBF6_9PEZI